MKRRRNSTRMCVDSPEVEIIHESKSLCKRNNNNINNNAKMTSKQEFSKFKDDKDSSILSLDGIMEAPVFHPSETEFKDPLKYIQKIQPQAEEYGICKVVPPKGWRPPFAIDPDQLQFKPRIQNLWLLEPKHRLSSSLLSFGFQDHTRSFNLGDFGDYADTFKMMYWDTVVEIGERQIEKEFWKNVLTPDRPVTVLYGADLNSTDVGSGFPNNNNDKDGKKTKFKTGCEMIDDDPYDIAEELDFQKYANCDWNLNNFPKLNASILRHIGSNVSGMTQPWVYIGMMFSAFCWHVEDHWSSSINFHHFGDTKTWYGIPGSEAENVDRRIKEYVPSLFNLQPDLMHNLNTMIHPSILIKAGIPVSRLDQRSGEFVITFPRAYHCGFNCGFNCAEAVNFATTNWLPFGFDSIRHYVNIKRNHVFCHEELIYKIMTSPESLGSNDAYKEAYAQFSHFIREEKELYFQLDQLGIKPKKRVKIEEIENDDERSCFFCSRTLFFSMISCECRTTHPNTRLRQSCGKHFRTLCSCAISKRHFLYRYKLKELIELDSKFYAMISNPVSSFAMLKS